VFDLKLGETQWQKYTEHTTEQYRSDVLHKISRLTDIPKIGEKTAQRLISHFNTEEAAVDAILSHDIASISEVEGVGQRYAISLSHEITRLTHGTSTDDFLKTPESIRIYAQVLDVMKEFCNSTYAKSRIHAFIPYPARCADIIADTQKSVGLGIVAARILGGNKKADGDRDNDNDKNENNDGELKELLRRVRPIVYAHATKRVRDRVLIATNRGEYDKARDMFGSQIECLLIEDGHEFLGTVRGYSKAYIAGREFYDMDLPDEISAEFIDLKKVDLTDIAPESALLFFEKNIKSIHSAILAARWIAKRDLELASSFDSIYADMDIEGLLLKLPDILQSQSQPQPEKGEKDEKDDRKEDESSDGFGHIRKLQHTIGSINEVVNGAAKFGNDRLSKEVSNSSITIEGTDMLHAVSDSFAIENMLKTHLSKAYTSSIKEAQEYVKDKLLLGTQYSQMVRDIFSDEVHYPITIKTAAVDRLRQSLNVQLQNLLLDLKKDAAKSLSGCKNQMVSLVRQVMEFDIAYSIGCFALHFNMSMPVFVDGDVLGIRAGQNIFLKHKHGDVEAVDYHVGTGAGANGQEDPDNARVVLLSGVNSGGKTSVLDLLAQTIILGHMGFPVPGNVTMGYTDELFYFAKSRGTLSAGAFETTLRNFASVMTDSRKVVLVDELEAITEPGASAKIIAGILDTMVECEGAIGVFVSHLAELILENTTAQIRVDGIEASGLDDNLNLIVERSPRINYFAKSTPQLIVERLSKISTGAESEFYGMLLEKFK